MLTVSTQLAPGDDLALFARMLTSVSPYDELLVFDLGRSDKDAKLLLAKFRARVVTCPTPPIVEEIRERQVKEARGDWVLVMDYDEELTPGAKDTIATLMQSTGACSAYALPRDNYSLGMPLRHGGWERDYVVRLIRRANLTRWPRNIHSSPRVKGCTVNLGHGLIHHKDASLSQMVAKTNRYSEVEAKQFLDGGLPAVTTLTLIRKPTMEFVRRYFLRLGLLDGSIGLIQSLYQAYSVFVTYAKLYELQQQKNV